MTDKNRYKYMLFAFIILSALILVGHYYFFVHKTLVVEEISPDGNYNIKCYAGPEYDQAVVVFETTRQSKTVELYIDNERTPIKASNFDINWKNTGALVRISSYKSEVKDIDLEFKVADKSILTDIN